MLAAMSGRITSSWSACFFESAGMTVVGATWAELGGEEKVTTSLGSGAGSGARTRGSRSRNDVAVSARFTT